MQSYGEIHNETSNYKKVINTILEEAEFLRPVQGEGRIKTLLE